jgi:cysteine desulfurase
MGSTIYFDNNATTRTDDRVLETMLPYFTEYYGNPSSTVHIKGLEAQRAIDKARLQVASFINSDPTEIIFTSGATESLNLAIKGVAEVYKSKGNQIIVAATEHMAVLETCHHLEKNGIEVTIIPVDTNGLIDLDQLEKMVNKNTLAVCVMLVNNETGIIQPVKQVSEIAHKHNSIFICDATQAPGKIPVDVKETGADLLCISAHKMYGPKGSGALYIKRKNPRVTLSPILDGGGQERGLRSGTLNVPGIVGLGKACEIILESGLDPGIKRLRDSFEMKLLQSGKVKINGDKIKRVDNTSNLQLTGVSAKELFQQMPDVFFSTGSACSTGKPHVSHVLKAMNLTDEEISWSVRFSFGRFNKEAEVNNVAERLIKLLN